MSQMTAPIWSMWDMVSPPPLRPSQLYHLEPLGLGTPFVESLSSYILRLAEAHHVLPVRLAHYVQGSVAEKSHFSSMTLQEAYALNSNSGLAQRWVSALEALTLRRDLHFLTMLPWAHAFAATGLMHKHLTWCPDCLHGWREVGVPLSIPLLWLVRAVSVCPRHQKPLHTRCPFCQQEQPVIAGTCWLGYCTRCGESLGDSRPTERANDPLLDNTTREQQLWVARSLGALLAAAPALNTALDEAAISRLAEQCVTQLGRGNMSQAARSLGIVPGVLSQWRRSGHRVNATTFFKVCFQGGISPLEALVRGRVMVRSAAPEAANEPEMRPRRHAGKKYLDKARLARELEGIIAHNEHHPLSIREVIGQLDCSKETLVRHFPEQYRILLQRYQEHKSAQLQAEREKAAQALAEALKEWPPPTTAQVAERVGYATGSLFKYFYPQFQAISARSQAYKEARAREKIERIRRALEEELASEEWPPPTTIAILARLRCQPKIAYKHCAEQCHTLSARHLAYRRSQKEERVEARRAQVRRVVQEIHDEGVYPSRNMISKRLSKPSMMLNPDAREAYQQSLRDLGYEDA